MQTSPLHLSLTVGLAAGLGVMSTIVVMPHTAQGYPTTAVSTGTNPVSAWAGTVNTTGTVVLSAPADQDIVVTDISLSCNYMCESLVYMSRSDGTQVGSFWVSGGYGSSYDSSTVQQQLASGLPVPAGQSLTIGSSSGTIAYTLSGYLAQP
jgi:hypothetical protein